MPDYADNYTARYVMRYRAGQMDHRFTVRYGTAASFGQIADAVNGLRPVFDAMKTRLSGDLSFLDAVFYPRGSDVASPAALPDGIETVVSTQNSAKSNGPAYLSLPWKTLAGGKQTIFFYGVVTPRSDISGGDFRQEISTAADLFQARGAWAELGLVTGNDSTALSTVATYFNFGINPKLVRKARRG